MARKRRSRKPSATKTKNPTRERKDLKKLYERLEVERAPYLKRARLNAKLTIPSLMTPDGNSDGDDLYIPYQSIGAEGINTMAEKTVRTLLPPNAPFFMTKLDDYTVEDLARDATARSKVEKAINERDRAVHAEVEALYVRSTVGEAVRQLLVAGNVLCVLPNKGTLRTYRLDRYVVQRASNGEFLQAITKEMIAYDTLPQEIKDTLEEEKMSAISAAAPSETDEDGNPKEVEVYTHFWLEGKFHHTAQYVETIEVEGTRGRWPVEVSGIMPLRMTALDGESYGRARIDEYVGDLTTVEGLQRAIVEASAAASKVNILVSPTGVTRAEDVANAENLDVITGRPEDIHVLQMDKRADLAIAQATLQDTTQRLGRAFLMLSSVQRNAERVTAEEIRGMAGELESVLGGFYSLLSNEFQLPFVRRLIDRMERQQKIPKLSAIKGPDGKPVAAPKITAGLEALGRGQDLTELRGFAQDIAEVLGPEAIPRYLNVDDLIRRLATARNMDADGLIKSPEDRQQEIAEDEQRQTKALQQQTMARMVEGAAKPVTEAVLNNAQEPPQA